MGLLVVHQLERVLDRAEQRVGDGQLAVLVGLDEGEVGQPHQPVERVDAADVRRLPPVGQLEELRDEFDVADRAGPRFDFAPAAAAAFELGFDLRLGRADAFADLIDRCAEQQRIDPLRNVFADGESPAITRALSRACFSQSTAVRLQILHVPVDGVDERTDRPHGRSRMSTRYKNPSAVDSVSALISRCPSVQNGSRRRRPERSGRCPSCS